MLNVAAGHLRPFSPTSTVSHPALASSVDAQSIHGASRFSLADSLSTAPPRRRISFVPSPRLLCASPKLREGRRARGSSAVRAEKVRRNDRTSLPVEMEEGNDEYGDDDDDEDGDELFVPFGKMKKWLDSKPRGFGVGKVYDTSIEEKLLEEITQSRQAQAANINKLKNNPVKLVAKKDTSQLKATEETPSGVRVRILNLPKKKNIHRDLKSAFYGTPGMLNIIPAVFGNSKTREPVCKGFAFVDFKSEKDAVRFAQTFSGQNITFGKVQKQIKCEIMNPHSSNAADGELESETCAAALSSQPMNRLDLEGEPAVTSDFDESFSDSWENLSSEEDNDLDGALLEAEFEEINEDMGSLALSEVNPSNNMDLISGPVSTSFSSERRSRPAASTKKQMRSQVKRQKPSGKGNGMKVKVPKLEVPGSAKRLRIKEKAVLTGVFSKYGSNADGSVNPDSQS